MFKKNTYRHYIDFLFTLSLFCVYAFCCVIILVFGTHIYKSTAKAMNDNYAVRTSYSYITEKIRQSDEYDSIRIKTEQDTDILMLQSEINGVTYATSLYEYNHHLYELFSRTDIELPLDAGQELIEISQLHFFLVTPKLLKITFYDTENIIHEVYVSLHSTTTEDSND